ncbi:MAG: substrate-binding domain-containing protein [Bacteroidota bacterium]|nr:substrate-binding domain-containing protein [Bacteroidota bacterium]
MMKISKPLITFMLLIFISLIFSKCQNEKKRTIGFLLPNLTDSRYLKDKAYFGEKASALGFEVETAIADNNQEMQEKQAIQMIDRGIKVLVISAVNQNLAASIVRYAHENDTKVIAYERLINNCDLDYLVTFDHEAVGKLQASFAVEHMPKGNYVIIGGDKGDKNAELIEKGQLEVLEPLIKSESIHIIYRTFIEDWSTETAKEQVAKVAQLSGEKIDVVLSANDAMAGGIIKSLEENQPAYPYLITGLDADLDACKRIVTGKQSMTVYKPFKKMASIAADLAVKLISHNGKADTNSQFFNGKKNVPTLLLNPLTINASNLKTTVLMDGFYKETEVYSNN